MNPAHLHLLVNHLPIIGALMALPLLALAIWRRTDLGALRAAVLVLVLAAVGAGASMRTGEEAEHAVEDLPWATETLIEEHEERAELATWVTVAAAVAGLALWGWSERKKAVPLGALLGLGLLSAASAGAMGWVGASGGVIRHEEIRVSGEGTQPDTSRGEHEGARPLGPPAQTGAGAVGGDDAAPGEHEEDDH